MNPPKNFLSQCERDSEIIVHFQRFFDLMTDQHQAVFSKWHQPRQMCLSEEAILAIMDVVGEAATVCDMGAGVSTWVFRKFLKNVSTVESIEGYLHVIESLCLNEDLPSDDFYLDMKDAPECDYVIFDYGDTQYRKDWLAIAWSKAKVAMYVDDTDGRMDHLETYRRDVLAFAAKNRAYVCDAKHAIDEFGRWGTWLCRNKNDIKQIRATERFKQFGT